MTKQKLVIKGDSIEHAIQMGLKQIGLPQSKTQINILQRESHSFFSQTEAVVSIVYDEDESIKALTDRAILEFTSRMSIRFEDSKIKIRVAGALFQEHCFKDDHERAEFLQDFLISRDIEGVDPASIKKIIRDTQSQHHFVTVKELDTLPLNDEGASIYLEPSADHMTCLAAIFYAGEITSEQVLEKLRERNITKGILINTIETAIENEIQGFFEIAVGKPPKHDEPTRHHIFFQENEQKEFSSMMDQLTVDTRTVKHINVVNRNELLMELDDPINGYDGYTICGEVIARKTSDDMAKLKLGKNVYFSDNEKEVYAKTAGHIVWKPDKLFIDVENIYVVEGNVDFTEGNIVGFVGKVIVKGDVRPKFSVVAEGDVEVHGSIEDAVVESTRGSVSVKGNIVHKNEGYVQACENINATLVINATLRAKNIYIEKEAMNSKLQASEEIHVSGEPGALVGGISKAKKAIFANSVGSENWIKTQVHVGDVTQLNKFRNTVRQRISEQRLQITELQQSIKLLEKLKETQKLTEAQKDQLESAADQIPEIEEEITFDLEEEEKIKSEIDSRKGSKLEVTRTLYPHCDLFIFDGYFLPNEEEVHRGFYCKEGLVISYPL